MILPLARACLNVATRNIPTLRKCSALAKRAENVKIYEVSPRCTLNGFICYKTILMPHDVNNTAETDKLILKCNKEISVNQIGTSFNLTTSRENVDDDTVCELHVPLKANINLTAMGDIKVGDLQGDGVRLFSELGKVTVGNLKCNEVSVGTNDKDINVEGNIEASKVELLCRKAGSINAQKIKSLGLKLDTNQGDINMNACYSRSGYFLSRTGNMNLRNVHNRCRVETLRSGCVKMIGFEGALEVALQSGKGDFQIQKLFDDSDILVREEGDITLRIPREILDHTEILIWSKGCYVDDDIPNTEDDMNDLTTIKKDGATIEHTLRVRCLKANCNVHLASWVDMVEKSFIGNKGENVKQQVN